MHFDSLRGCGISVEEVKMYTLPYRHEEGVLRVAAVVVAVKVVVRKTGT